MAKSFINEAGELVKICSKCHEEKPISCFYKNSTRSDGYSHRCKFCQAAHKYAPNRECEICGKPFYAAPHSVTNGNGRFCSRVCSAKSRDCRITKRCDICGKEIIVHRYEVERGWGRFCSVNCENRWRSGENAPRWMGDNPINPGDTGRGRAQAMYDIADCEICGASKDSVVIHRHHVDENPMNNEPDNIMILCAKCHRAQHPRKSA